MTSENNDAISPLARRIGDALYYVGIGGSLLTIIAWLVLAFVELKGRSAQAMMASEIASTFLPATETAAIPFAIGWALRHCLRALGTADPEGQSRKQASKGRLFRVRVGDRLHRLFVLLHLA